MAESTRSKATTSFASTRKLDRRRCIKLGEIKTFQTKNTNGNVARKKPSTSA